MTVHTDCHMCRAPYAPFWFRPPGFRSQLPAEMRGKYIRTCGGADCVAKALARLAALPGFSAPAPPQVTTPTTPEPAQRALI